MPRKRKPRTNPTAKELAEAKRIAALPKEIQRQHPSALPADQSKLGHIHTYGSLPEFYRDIPFRCRDCGKAEIWKAADQKWYYEETKAHMDASAVRCRDCRKARKAKKGRSVETLNKNAEPGLGAKASRPNPKLLQPPRGSVS